MIIVPDASVILKWVLEKEDEPDYSKAIALQEAFLDEHIEIKLPTLWRYEVGNVLRIKKPAIAGELMSALIPSTTFWSCEPDNCVGPTRSHPEHGR